MLRAAATRGLSSAGGDRRVAWRQRDQLRCENERLKRQVDDARRAAHRQAAPFAKALAPHPRRLIRKRGKHYGVKAHRRRPRRIDERHEAPLPCAYPHCGGAVMENRRPPAVVVPPRRPRRWCMRSSRRGYAEAAPLLGEDFAGVIVRDGWAPYRRFTKAIHQTCLAHLLRPLS